MKGNCICEMKNSKLLLVRLALVHDPLTTHIRAMEVDIRHFFLPIKPICKRSETEALFLCRSLNINLTHTEITKETTLTSHNTHYKPRYSCYIFLLKMIPLSSWFRLLQPAQLLQNSRMYTRLYYR